MGLSKSFNKITKKEFKNTQKVLNALEVLGIDESMLEDVKHIGEIKKELEEAKNLIIEITDYLRAENAKNNSEMGTPQDLARVMSEPVEELNPYGR